MKGKGAEGERRELDGEREGEEGEKGTERGKGPMRSVKPNARKVALAIVRSSL